MDLLNAIGLATLMTNASKDDMIYLQINFVISVLSEIGTRMQKYDLFQNHILVRAENHINDNVYIRTAHFCVCGYLAYKNSRSIQFLNFIFWVEYFLYVAMIYASITHIMLTFCSRATRLSIVRKKLAKHGIVLPITDGDIDRISPLRSAKDDTEIKDNCAICMDELTTKMLHRKLPCNHCFHATCVDEWLKKHGNCPICRACVV